MLNTVEESDLEDGEIRDEYEAISDSSLSEISIAKKSLEDDLEYLREEALKSMQREEEPDESLEEEQYRLEALKSLLKNMETEEDEDVSKCHTISNPKVKRRKRNAKEELILKSQKDSISETCYSPSIQCFPTAKPVSSQSRPWYLKTEFLLPSLPDTPSLSFKFRNNSHPALRKSYPAAFKRVAKIVSNPSNHKTKAKLCFKSNPKVTSIPQPQTSLVRNGKYKLVNKSKYNLRISERKFKPETAKSLIHSSRFSINRTKYPEIKINPKDFIIKLEDDDSSKDEEEEDANILQYEALTKLKIEESLNSSETNSDVNDCLQTIPGSKDCPLFVDVKQEPLSDNRADELCLVLGREDSRSFENTEVMESFQCDIKMVELSEIERLKRYQKSAILIQAEENLLSIREKLLNDLNELDCAVKRDALESDELDKLLTKLVKLKSIMMKFEEKVKLQQCKLTKNMVYVNSLFYGIQTRTQNCAKFKEVCCLAGKQFVGPAYKPPDRYEEEIATKRNEIDFWKNMPHKTN